MSLMSTPYELSGRTRQKARTRGAMLAAARELLANGVTPTVEQAAERAGVSRATAYRYFPNQRSLMVACFPQLQSLTLLGKDPPADAAERLDVVIDHLGRQLIEFEPELRAMLRLSLETPAPGPEALPLRRGRAIGWIADALEPLRGRLGDDAVRRLAVAVRATLGIEPLVWLTDVAGLPPEEAVELMKANARCVLRAALDSS